MIRIRVGQRQRTFPSTPENIAALKAISKLQAEGAPELNAALVAERAGVSERTAGRILKQLFEPQSAEEALQMAQELIGASAR